jgi:hypothetical protein
MKLRNETLPHLLADFDRGVNPELLLAFLRLQYLQMAAGVVTVALIVGMALVACTPPAVQTQTPRLRITNSGVQPIENLIVWFPEDQIEFGDIPAGATTESKDVPNGVYRYAAYRLEVEGQMITQPVIDWVGEEPLLADRFTYTLDFDPSRPQMQMVQLLEVTQGE